MMQIKLLINSFIHFVQDIKEIWKQQWGNGFILSSVELMYNKCQKVNFRCNGSNTNSPEWIKKEKMTKYPKIEDDECF